MKRTVLIAISVVLVILTWAGNCPAFTKGDAVVFIVPMTAFESDHNVWVGTKFIAKVGLGNDGRLVLNGDEGWRLRALPTILTGTVSKLKHEKKERATKLIVSATVPGHAYDRRVIFEIPDGVGDWQSALEEITTTTESSRRIADQRDQRSSYSLLRALLSYRIFGNSGKPP